MGAAGAPLWAGVRTRSGVDTELALAPPMPATGTELAADLGSEPDLCNT
jgi:hypothetical protein